MNVVYFLLGSNLNYPLEQLDTARTAIAAQIGSISHSSSIYRTAAWGLQEQPDFFNQVIQVESELSPETCMQKALNIEEQMGRKRKEKYGPRTIDIDLLLYNNLQLNTTELVIPHPEICHRRFTLVPLCEIDPGLLHPVNGCSMKELLMNCEDHLPVDKI